MMESGDGVEPRHANGSESSPADGAQTSPSGEQILGTEPLDRETRISLLEDAHDFPGPFTIVVIAHAGEEFQALLRVTLEDLQGEAGFSITQRVSRKGTYISYRVEVHVSDAAMALDRKDALAKVTGVVTLL